jgi:aspartate-semialdehyde dehydrogenase
MNKKFSIALIGATGLVGRELLTLLQNSSLPIKSISLFASQKSQGKFLDYREEKLPIHVLSENSFDDIDLAFFCAGSEVSKQFIPHALKNHTLVIDNSSLFRMDEKVPLVIPEINPHSLKNHQGIIASPNCTTTLMLMALAPLHKEFMIKRIVASTYQSASGGGVKLMQKLLDDTKNYLENPALESLSYGFNLYLHNSSMKESRYCEEELKMVRETKKILEDPSIQLTATCVRVPIFRAHSLSINVEFMKDFSLEKVYDLLKKQEGLTILEDYLKQQFPTPHDASFKQTTFVGRIREDISQKNTLDLWIVGDQLLKGAALNALQIAEKLHELHLLPEKSCAKT